MDGVINMNEAILNKNLYYVVGVSGGCDSMYLLDILRQKGYHIFVAHVNYNYRYDSYVDYELVRDYCATYGIPFYYREFHDSDYHEGNFQDQAREMRYCFYKQIYQMYDCDGLILGHHLDDHLETIYMQLSRHETVYYLGIKEVNDVYGMRVIRPLMGCFKKDILKACQRYHIGYHDDYTNFETDFQRDKVRNTVLNHYSDRQKEELLEKAKQHNQRIQEIEFKVKPYYQHYKKNGYINYHEIPKELLSTFLYFILRDVIDSQMISVTLITEMIRQMESSKPNIQMNLPVNYLFIKEYDNVYIIDKKGEDGFCYVFDKRTSFECPFFCLREYGHINEGIYLNQDDYPITIRSMQDGDKIKTSSGTKKLSRLFINAKIPALKRKTWPVVVNRDKTIILVPNIAKNIDYLTTKPNVFVIK